MKPFSLLLYLLFYFVLVFYFTACRKKTEPTTYAGQLLLSKKYPVPLANRTIEIYQGGNAPAIGLNSGSTSSSEIGLTNSNGYFQINFSPGSSRFIFLSGTNSGSLVLQSALTDASFPSFSRKNFPDPAYDPSKPIYVGKIIDTLVINVFLFSDLNSTDTIGLRANTINGGLSKEYTGLFGNAGLILTVDTVYDMLLTEFDCYEKKFINNFYAGRKWTTGAGYNTINSEGIPSPYLLPDTDESKVEMMFSFRK
jgi:hypothetical protein